MYDLTLTSSNNKVCQAPLVRSLSHLLPWKNMRPIFHINCTEVLRATSLQRVLTKPRKPITVFCPWPIFPQNLVFGPTGPWSKRNQSTVTNQISFHNGIKTELSTCRGTVIYFEHAHESPGQCFGICYVLM